MARISSFLFEHGANILHSQQHQDAENGLFLMRTEWDPSESDLDQQNFGSLFSTISVDMAMSWKVSFSDVKTRVAIFVSKFDHCLADLLYRHRMGDLNGEIVLVLSNHPQARTLVEFYRLPFYEIPVTADQKERAEQSQLDLMAKFQIDLIVLARYMQVLSPNFVHQFPHRIINIHHSFLPAFQGAKPYHRAFQRGVKIIGATSHYVTEDLDEGPIIHQDVVRVSHRDQIEDLVRRGRDLESMALSRAVQLHLEHRIVAYDNKTVILE